MNNRLLASAFATLALCCGTVHADEAKIVVHPVIKTSVTIANQPITLPTEKAELTVSVYEIPAGAALPEHRHESPRYGYVLSGALRVVNSDTGKVADFGPGDFIVEAIGSWHAGSNPGKEPLKLLVIDQAEKGHRNLELR